MSGLYSMSKECTIELVETTIEEPTVSIIRHEVLTIGRVLNSDSMRNFVLPFSEVSTNHAEIRYSDKGWVVIDLKSKNGTTLNGYSLGAYVEYALIDNDVIGIAQYKLIVHLPF